MAGGKKASTKKKHTDADPSMVLINNTNKMNPSVNKDIALAKLDDKKKPIVNSSEKEKNMMPSEIKTYQNSVDYIKKLLIVTVSNITYLRGVFTEECYEESDFENIKVKILKSKDSNYQDIKIIYKWLRGACEALELKYLKIMTLAFYTEDNSSESVIETYEFSIFYTDKDVRLMLTSQQGKSTKEYAQTTSGKMLRALVQATRHIEKLPPHVFVQMKLDYYNEITPIDYEPYGFKTCDFSEYKFKNDKSTLDLGETDSNWHNVKLALNLDTSILNKSIGGKISDDQDGVEYYDEYANKENDPIEYDLVSRGKSVKSGKEEAIQGKEVNKLTKIESSDDETEVDLKDKDDGFNQMNETTDIISSQMKKLNVSVRFASEDDIVNEDNAQSDAELFNIKNISNSSSKLNRLSDSSLNVPETPEDKQSTKQSSSYLKKSIINCPCKTDDRSKSLILVQCEICKNAHHAICYFLLLKDKHDLDEWSKDFKHYCNHCFFEAERLNVKVTDEILSEFDDEKCRIICLRRRALYYCYVSKNRSVRCQEIADYLNVKVNFAEKMLESLEKKGTLTRKSDDLFAINSSQLKYYVESKFKTVNELIKKKNQKHTEETVESDIDSDFVGRRISINSFDDDQISKSRARSKKRLNDRDVAYESNKRTKGSISRERLEKEIN